MSHQQSGVQTYAGLGVRFLALAMDFAIFCAVFFPITRLVKGVSLMRSSDHRWTQGWFVTDPLCIIFFVVIVAYYICLEGLLGATIGKRLLGLRVISAGGGKPGIKKAFLRNIFRLADGLPALNILGVIAIAISPERTRIGDLVAKTRVVCTR